MLLVHATEGTHVVNVAGETFTADADGHFDLPDPVAAHLVGTDPDWALYTGEPEVEPTPDSRLDLLEARVAALEELVTELVDNQPAAGRRRRTSASD